MQTVAVKRIRQVKKPTRTYDTDAGLDFYVPDDFNAVRLIPDASIRIPSGIIVAVPSGYMGLFLNKSGIASQLDLLVGAQVVDHGYSDEVHICLHNVGGRPIEIKPGMKIVQMVFIKVATPEVIEVSDIDQYTERGSRGFGSSGIYYCTVCGKEPVDADSGYDTCPSCTGEMTRLIKG